MKLEEENLAAVQQLGLMEGSNRVIERLKERNAELERTNRLLLQLLAECRHEEMSRHERHAPD